MSGDTADELRVYPPSRWRLASGATLVLLGVAVAVAALSWVASLLRRPPGGDDVLVLFSGFLLMYGVVGIRDGIGWLRRCTWVRLDESGIKLRAWLRREQTVRWHEVRRLRAERDQLQF